MRVQPTIYNSQLATSMRNKQVGTLLFKELQKITNNATLSVSERVEALYRLLSLSFVEATRDEKVLFTTLFSRISLSLIHI